MGGFSMSDVILCVYQKQEADTTKEGPTPPSRLHPLSVRTGERGGNDMMMPLC